MGRKSVRENKSAYQVARENAGFTIEKASDNMGGVTSDRIAKLENGTVCVQPEDVMAMSECYKAPELCNYYCTHECAIGKEKIEEIAKKQFSQIAIETLNSLNRLTKQKDRFLEIVEDGAVEPSEYDDFLLIKTTLDKMAASINSLQLWVDGQIANGKIDKKTFG